MGPTPKRKRKSPRRREVLLACALRLVGQIIAKNHALRYDAMDAADAAAMAPWVEEIARGEVLLMHLARARRVDQLHGVLGEAFTWLAAEHPMSPATRVLH